MKAYLTRRYRFPAAHRLHLDDLSDADNRRIYGKCNNPHGHGHNYALEVTVSGQIDPETGMVCNLADLDLFISQEIVARYDHMDLNRLTEFASTVPTTENLCVAIFDRLKRFQYAKVEHIRIQETKKNSFELGNLLP
jgi:6-pyruvoyltetrahydropterin/6-carboxytetrahydropterin synthase